MNKTTVTPYINFIGRAREAMEFYRKIFGGEITLLTYNPDGAPKQAEPGEPIMHCVLKTDSFLIMGTDGMEEYRPTVGDNMAVAVSGDDEEYLTRVFAALGDGGNVKMDLRKESWGDQFGWVSDKYGINWMVDIEAR